MKEFSTIFKLKSSIVRMFEYKKSKKIELINELIKGENSGFTKNFDRKNFLNNLHKKHIK